MHFNYKSLFNILSAISLCVMLAACQTGGLKPGSIQTNYRPSGWTAKQANGITGYICKIPACKVNQAIGYGPVKVKGNVEKYVRSGHISKKLLNAIANVHNVAANGHEKLTVSKKVVTESYSGFDFGGYFKDQTGKKHWVKARAIFQDNRGSVIFSVSTSRNAANRNFSKYMGTTTIKRLP